MTSNNQVVLEALIESQKNDIAPNMSVSTYFEMFSAEQLLKSYDLSYEEVESGLVGAGGDGGIDSIFVFVNGQLVDDDTETNALGNDILIELFINQSKFEASFSELAIDRLMRWTHHVFRF